MIPTLKAEFKKLLTVRSTYILVLIALCMTGFFTYMSTAPSVYEEYPAEESSTQTTADNKQEQAAANQQPPEPISVTVSHDLSKEKVLTNMIDAIPVVTIFIAIAVVLLMAHEFRYNTINYTLTSSNSRTKVLASKLIVSIIFVIIAALLAIGVTVVSTYVAVSIKNLNLPPQDYNWTYVLARLVGYCLGFSLIGLAIVTIVRNTVVGIVSLLMLPTIDAIVAGLLSTRNIEATKVLPYSALGRINNLVNDLASFGIREGTIDAQMLPATLLGASAVVIAWLIGLWLIAWILFLRRDAS
jgi:ABC-type transport system involved in multi-copper enzyme maturation permease subunit